MDIENGCQRDWLSVIIVISAISALRKKKNKVALKNPKHFSVESLTPFPPHWPFRFSLNTPHVKVVQPRKADTKSKIESRDWLLGHKCNVDWLWVFVMGGAYAPLSRYEGETWEAGRKQESRRRWRRTRKAAEVAGSRKAWMGDAPQNTKRVPWVSWWSSVLSSFPPSCVLSFHVRPSLHLSLAGISISFSFPAE